MIDVAVELLVRWLEDPNTGPNIYLPNVERAERDDDLEVRPIAIVLSPFRDLEAHEDKEPPRYPALIVAPFGPVTIDGEVNQALQEGEALPLLLRVVLDHEKGPRSLRLGAYYVRALNRAVSAFLADTVEGQAAREGRGVQVIACTDRTYILTSEALGAATVVAAELLTLYLRDNEAT